VDGDGEPALHVGYSGAVNAAGVVAERTLGGSTERKNRVVVAQQRDPGTSLSLERGMEVQTLSANRYELGVEAVSLHGVRKDRGEPIELLDCAAGRIDIHPGLKVRQEQVELGADAR
jgi:hypothetical protein